MPPPEIMLLITIFVSGWFGYLLFRMLKHE